MPSLPWAKSSKSHQSVASSPGNVSPNPAIPTPTVNSDHRGPESQQPPLQPHPAQGEYRDPYPQRATSTIHRQSAHISGQPPQDYQHPQTVQASDSHRHSYQSQPQSPPQSQPQSQSQSQRPLQLSPSPVPPEPKKQSLRSRIAAGVKGHKDAEAARQAQKNGLGRAQSVRKSDLRPQEYQSQEHGRLQASPQWHQRQGSSPNLSTSIERDEDNLDPFLQQDSGDNPQVPPKDLQYQPNPQQLQQLQHPQFAQPGRQEQYIRPPLGGRVSTEGSYQTQGGVDHYSPDQSQGPQQQINPQQQYQSYQPQPVVQLPQKANEYQAFKPQGAPSPLLVPASLQGQGQDIVQQQQQQQQQQNYYQYQQVSQQNQGQSSLDTSPQSLHYPQQQQLSPQSQPQIQSQPQPRQAQDPQLQQSQSVRPSSHHHSELQHPQATRLPQQFVQQGQQVDLQQSSQLRPPSSHQLAPPSPLQPQAYQAYDTQQIKQTQPSEPRASNTTPPQQGQENMAPSGQGSSRSTMRKVNDGGQQPGAPSREGSLLQEPPAQASQGQPYRGEKAQQAQSGGEMGRATPPPKTPASDMTDEEIEKLVKEHDVLREKYQKVKRYFFEQQSQVHQLQNTLANQRLSLSRTSWDDSEYSTRFNRLDGLIAQLSFSIRKDWKTIPQWLQIVVNKTAVETGKQEMTAVGRAFISHWLVENIFDKYFHPDLEPGFSTQLQTIATNIRRFAPACHSTEDEESLNAKVINWRLATLEGLAEALRAPSAATNRQNLTDTLNEKLIASLQMHLSDPAPADLNGGVPMIIELAVSIAQHLPLESREVHIEYFSPGSPVSLDLMKIESGIPALTAPLVEADEADRASIRSSASKMDDSSSIAEQEQQNAPSASKEEKKRSVFSFSSSKKPTTAPVSLSKRESSLGQGGSQQSLINHPGGPNGSKDEPQIQRVRIAVGVAVQIRGKSILIKAPVYST